MKPGERKLGVLLGARLKLKAFEDLISSEDFYLRGLFNLWSP